MRRPGRTRLRTRVAGRLWLLAAIMVYVALGPHDGAVRAASGEESESPSLRRDRGPLDTADVAAIQQLMKRYERALQQRDLLTIVELYDVDVKDPILRAAQEFFARTRPIAFTISRIDIQPNPPGALVVFTRDESFEDVQTGKRFENKLRTTIAVVRIGRDWKLAPPPKD